MSSHGPKHKAVILNFKFIVPEEPDMVRKFGEHLTFLVSFKLIAKKQYHSPVMFNSSSSVTAPPIIIKSLKYPLNVLPWSLLNPMS